MFSAIVRFAVACTVAFVCLFPPAPLGAQPPADLMIESVTGGVSSPVAIRHAGDGSGRIFIVEQGGLIKIYDGSTLLATPFIDLTSVVVSGGEQGLLGLAFHPNYASNGYFYVNYTRSANPLDQTVVARYSVSAGNANVADPMSATEILVVDQPFSNHNGGDIHFNPIDGYLYVGMGDGGGWDTSQDLTSLLGKMLRIDVDGAGAPLQEATESQGAIDTCGVVANYAVPNDNPYNADGNACDEIWSVGLRNPWRWSFDRQTGDLLIGDVGEGDWEEMNYAAHNDGAVNFGWPCLEGPDSFQPGFCSGGETLTPAFYNLNHDTGACSIIGGYVYRGNSIPSLRGYIMFNDWCSGETFFANQTSPGTWSTTQWNSVPGFNLVGYGEDEDGEIYLAFGEEISRLVSPSSTAPIFEDGFEDEDFSAWSAVFP